MRLGRLGRLALIALPLWGCAKGREIAQDEIVIFRLEPDAGGAVDAGNSSMPEPSAPASAIAPMPSAPPMPPSQSPDTAEDAGAADAGRSEDRPADAGD